MMKESFSGQTLKERNQQIIECIQILKSQRNDLNYLIIKQQEEKTRLQTEIERITYKLSLISKSLSQRLNTRANYDKTIKEAEDNYFKLVESSNTLFNTIYTEANQLEETMDKKIGTEININNPMGKDD